MSVTTRTVIVTSSWDDGHRLDERLAGLLDHYQVPGTFYIAPRNEQIQPADRLPASAIRRLDARFEIGGHTLNHRPLSALTTDEAAADIVAGRDALEQIVGHRVASFCYPCGDYRAADVEAVKAAGFTMARTVERFSTAPAKDPWQTPTTVHAYRHLVDGPQVARLARYRPRGAARLFWHWDALAMALFDRVLVDGGVWHLWGHSWEIDGHGDWERLERVLGYVGARRDVTYVTNGELVPALAGADRATGSS